MVERTYELKLVSGRRVRWEGTSPDDAIRRYEACHPNEVVLAWRDWPQHGLFVGLKRIVEPGELERHA